MRAVKLLFTLLQTNLIKTIWFNFKMLPIRKAYKLPIYLYGRVSFRSTSGKIVLPQKCHSGMIKIGKRDYYTDTNIAHTIWTINGTIIFNGAINFLRGSYVLVSNNATLTFGTCGTFIGSNTKIICFDRITIGDTTHITWDCQLMDTSFHYVETIFNHNISPLTEPLSIGNRVWVGNRTTISKGAMIPDDTIVASNSLVNKDHSIIGAYALLAGTPATVKATGLRRIFDTQLEKQLDKKYGYSRTHL